MRKLLSITLALMLLLGLAPIQPAEATEEGFATQTVMVYIVGSDLEPQGNYATTDITEMMRSGLDTDQVTVLIMTGGTTSWGNSIVPADKLSIYRLAVAINVPSSTLERFRTGRTNLTPDLARRLGDYFGTGAEYWTRQAS